MGKGRPRAVEKAVMGQQCSSTRLQSSKVSLDIPSAPVFYPNEDEFTDPLEYLYKIREVAEPYGICKIVPPKSWKPPFALDLNSFTFPTKAQAIHRLQARPASCDSKTFELEYTRFLMENCGRKLRKKVVFEGKELDLCRLFNSVKRFGGYDKVVREKKWGEVYRFVRSSRKISDCAKHVLCQLYREHLYDYEEYYNRLNKEGGKSFELGVSGNRKREAGVEQVSGSKRRMKGKDGGKIEVSEAGEVEMNDHICEQCKSGLHGDVMLLCDRCDRGWHTYCLSPPLKQVPPGNWYCFECLNSDKDSFGFVPGKHYTVEAFRRIADRAKRKWIGSVSTSRVQVEKTFWEIVEGLVGEVEVMYGSDLDTSVYGSGFPRTNDQKPESVDAKVWEEYCASPWNLNNLPKLKGSMLRAVHHNITGVMVPWLYIGMLFSAFCWHFEDNCFYSMNYHHWGEPKCWYSIPGSKASAFEEVMRNSLPDLFDAQPDLLFQLVTMLNPSVLLDNGVPVYTVLQEPGNFVITFPRSYHGGFNLGLNCAEAVNFAPADWLPYGRFGAELYKLYHKAPVLSHEELLCVVAKSDWDTKTSTYLKEELVRLYSKEKIWRERLWRNGVVKSSSMSPRKCPEYVGTEEDPTCVICLQYLYLSAVVCRCRPSAFVCLEHWEHLCECNPSKLRLLYRHTLAELNSFVLKMEYDGRASQSTIVTPMTADSDGVGTLIKKEKSEDTTMVELAERWLLHSSKVLQNEFSKVAYRKVLKEADQFLWGGSEMDHVRNMKKKLTEAHNWAMGVGLCVSKVENWSSHMDLSKEKVDLEYIDKLLNYCPLPCNEPRHLKLKEYAEEAKVLMQEIEAALLTCSNMSELELLYSKACDFPINVKGSEKLGQRISSAKVWVENARKCLSEKRSGAVELGFLCKLKSEILELQVHFVETEVFLDLLRQAESCQACCNELLRNPTGLKNVEVFLQDADSFVISIPEVKLLRQHHDAAVTWVTRFKGLMDNVHEWEDQDSVIDVLTCMLKDGKQLKIKVDELALADLELKKASCRAKALKMRNSHMSIDFIQEVILEATMLHIEKERLFVNMCEVLEAAKTWEERAKHVLSKGGEMSEFSDLLRISQDISVKLPSLAAVEDAVSAAKSWLKRAKQFLETDHSVAAGLSSYLKVDALKELVSESKLLKVSFEEQKLLEEVLKKCKKWELDACCILQDAERLFNIDEIGGINDGVISKIDQLVTSLKSTTKSGLSLGLYFDKVPELQNACSVLQWCYKALSFCSIAPSLKEVEGLMEIRKDISATFTPGSMWSKLVDGVEWLRKAVGLISASCSDRSSILTEAENVLALSQKYKFPFPVVIDHLAETIEKQKMWQEEVQQYFSLQLEERSWLSLLQLKDRVTTLSFGCPELDMVLSEVGKVENWKQRCKDSVIMSNADLSSFPSALLKVKESLQKSMHICNSYQSRKARKLCICRSSVSKWEDYLTCSSCKDWYHLQCLKNTVIHLNATKLSICHYCQLVESGSLSQNRDSPMRFCGKRVNLKVLIELVDDSKDFCVSVKERDVLHQLVEQALEFKACLLELVNSASNLDIDVGALQALSVAVKAVELAGVCDHQVNHHLEKSLERYRWKTRVKDLLEDLQKPTMRQIKLLLKEGQALDIPSEDYFRQKLTKVKSLGLRWIDNAKKVSTDSGALGLEKVFELITEGENLLVNVEKELELLRARSMLYCICRKPYDPYEQRAMIACDQCDEWYHFDCIRLDCTPAVFICAACQPRNGDYTCMSVSAHHERSKGAASVEPRTPSPKHTRKRKQHRNGNARVMEKMLSSSDQSDSFRVSRGIDKLRWQSRKPFRRNARKRTEFESVSSFFPLH